MLRWAILLCMLLVGMPLVAAAQEPFDALPGWRNEHVADVVPLFAASCPRLAPSFRAACATARTVPPGDEAAARAFVEGAFRPTHLGDALTTGYFEMDMRASRTADARYRWPLLRPPHDPTAFDRGQILSGALAGQGLELAWFASPADLYFVQLQGSARLVFADGSVMRVGGAAQNGRASVPTGNLFRDVGIPNNELSIPMIRAWSVVHGREAETLLARDPAYFFMRERRSAADQGPTGTLGVPLTPLRSIAVDPAFVPLGAPVWLDTEISALDQTLRRLMLAQDTGEPIKGADHVDLFFGPGPRAEALGGRQHARAGLWVLLPR